MIFRSCERGRVVLVEKKISSKKEFFAYICQQESNPHCRGNFESADTAFTLSMEINFPLIIVNQKNYLKLIALAASKRLHSVVSGSGR